VGRVGAEGAGPDRRLRLRPQDVVRDERELVPLVAGAPDRELEVPFPGERAPGPIGRLVHGGERAAGQPEPEGRGAGHGDGGDEEHRHHQLLRVLHVVADPGPGLLGPVAEGLPLLAVVHPDGDGGGGAEEQHRDQHREGEARGESRAQAPQGGHGVALTS
jgi:hypothetical protein